MYSLFLCLLVFLVFQFYIYIVLELLKGGELLDRIRKKKSFIELEVSNIMFKLVNVVDFMYFKGIVYRDLKLEVRRMSVLNILLIYENS